MSPLSHGLDRVSSWSTLLAGGVVIFPSHDKSKLMMELRIAEPTSVAATPVFWTWRYESFLAELATATATATAKLITPIPDRQENDLLLQQLRTTVLQRFSRELGPRIRSVVTGGAPTPTATMAFMYECYDAANISVHESFGTTETGAITVNGSIPPGVEVYLRPLEEVHSDLKHVEGGGEVGEILVKKSIDEMSSGYFNNSEETIANFVDGYYATGDIGRRLENGQIEIIDRIKNVFKLAQGEFVAPQKIEEVLLKCADVAQVFVTGHTTERQVVAIVVLTSISAVNITPSMLLQSFRRLGVLEGLAPYEIPVAVHIEATHWSIGGALLTSSGKMKRSSMNTHYAEIINDLYATLKQNPVDIVSRIMWYLTNFMQRGDDIDEEWSGQEIVGQLLPDSISLVQLSHRIESDFDIEISFDMLLDNSTTLTSLSYSLVLLRGGGSSCEKYNDDKVIRDQTFWQEESTLSVLDLEQSVWQTDNCANKMEVSRGEVVLLTGATGFLGPYMLYNLAKRYSKVICLVRAPSDGDALIRVKQLLDKLALVLDVGAENVEVLAGDFEQPLFALSPSNVHRLETEVHEIYHSGAKVSSVLSYDQLRTSNVESTKFIIRLACRGCRKRIHFVSSTSALATDVGILESAENLFTPTQRVSELSGYGQTKWVR